MKFVGSFILWCVCLSHVGDHAPVRLRQKGTFLELWCAINAYA